MNWIEACSSYPPDDMGVLLYVIETHKYSFDAKMVIGFFNSESNKYQYESFGNYRDIEVNENDVKRKVLAWTLCPNINKKVEKILENFLKSVCNQTR